MMARLPLIFRRPGSVPPPAGPRIALSDDQRRLAHMAASLLLDYPGAGFAERAAAVEASVAALPAELSREFAAFLEYAAATPAVELEAEYVATFDLKRRCCLYLTYFQAGDTRKRGAALVSFIATYRAAGWEFDTVSLRAKLRADIGVANTAAVEVISGALAA